MHTRNLSIVDAGSTGIGSFPVSACSPQHTESFFRPTCGQSRHVPSSPAWGPSLWVPASVYSHKSLTSIQPDRKAGCTISERACSDVTVKMQLYRFARLFQGQHRRGNGPCLFVRGRLLLCSLLTCCRPICLMSNGK
jgi:hypothetical protein